MIPSPCSLLAKASEMVRSAGIDNFHIDQGFLVLCGTRYQVHSCSCDDPDCSGVQLMPDAAIAH